MVWTHTLALAHRLAIMFAGHKTLDEINLMVLKLQNWLAQKHFFDFPLAL